MIVSAPMWMGSNEGTGVANDSPSSHVQVGWTCSTALDFTSIPIGCQLTRVAGKRPRSRPEGESPRRDSVSTKKTYLIRNHTWRQLRQRRVALRLREGGLRAPAPYAADRNAPTTNLSAGSRIFCTGSWRGPATIRQVESPVESFHPLRSGHGGSRISSNWGRYIDPRETVR